MKGLNISKGAGKLVRRKVDVRTVCIALEVDADASEKMHQTRRLYGQACNLLVPIVVSDTDRKKRLWQRYNLHKAAYPMVRTKMSVLGAQLACNVMRSVSSMYQSWISNHPNFSKDKPEFADLFYAYGVLDSGRFIGESSHLVGLGSNQASFYLRA